MQDFTLPGPPNNLWIGERATDTVAGVLLLASELIDGVSEHLLDVWQQTEASPSDYPPPAAWALEPEPVASFDGITGTTSPLRPSSGHTHEQFARRLALARAHPARDTVRRRHALEAAPIHGYGAHPLRPVDRQLAGL